VHVAPALAPGAVPGTQAYRMAAPGTRRGRGAHPPIAWLHHPMDIVRSDRAAGQRRRYMHGWRWFFQREESVYD
jgi:hypothetical protein